MKKVVFALLLVPFVMMAQESQPDPIFMNVMLTPHSDKIKEFEMGMAEHNKKFHTEEGKTVSVFWVASGKNSGKYVWSLGPTTWEAMDEAANPDAAHTDHWNTSVAPYADAVMETSYWKGDMAHSNFTKDFTLKNMSIFTLDMKRFKQMEFMAVLDKVTKVFKAKDSEQQWGVYWNTLPNMEGQDMVWINFFDSMSWMGQDDKFPQWYEEVHGQGSFIEFLKEFEAATDGDYQELWMFRSDLSGADGQIAAVTSGQ
jgi:hypothetical protein